MEKLFELMATLVKSELKAFLEEKVAQYNQPRFLLDDPLQIPHRFDIKEDIEISGFLTSIIAWGNRKSIIRSATKLIELMDGEPYGFVLHHGESDLKALESFVHRTFNGTDLVYFIRGLRHIYLNHGGLEDYFTRNSTVTSTQIAISRLKKDFFALPHPHRTKKHLADPSYGSAAKRINMFLRWMVRDASTGVDFGLWKGITPAQLSCPLDVHSGTIARKLGLLNRKQNDAKSVAELDSKLRELDPHDPVKYDFALFGLGAFEKF